MISIRQQALGIAAAAALSGAAMGAAMAAPVPVEPAAQAFSVGQFKLFALRDMQNVLPNDGKVFGKDVGPDKVADALKNAGQPTDKITLDVDALLVQTPDRVVLLDTGLGPKVGGVLMQSLGKSGVQPDQVTDILITHAHGDHVGGLVTADGRPAFLHAAIHMSATEWQWMQSMPNFKAMIDAIGPSVKTFKPGDTVIPGFNSVSLPGHTPGHVGYEITSGDQHFIDIGDIVHSSIVSLEEPVWGIGYDTDLAQGRITREKELAKLAGSHEQIFAPHFPFPGVGTIARSGAGYAWHPSSF